MDTILLYIAAFLRPLLSFNFIGASDEARMTELFGLAAIALMIPILMAVLYKVAVRKIVIFSPIDLMMGAFVVWCISIYVIYYDVSNGRDVVKMLVPLFTYFIAKNVLNDRKQYLRMIALMIGAYSVPIVLSAALILSGGGIDYVNYWTGVSRYQGAYVGSHELGHHMAFAIMLIFLYFAVRRSAEEANETEAKLSWQVRGYLMVLLGAALYCLAMAQTRTQIISVTLFLGLYFFYYNRRLFYMVGAAAAIAVAALWPFLYETLFFDFAKVETGAWGQENLGSGRPRMWMNNLEVYINLPIDQIVAGAGIGNVDANDGTSEIVLSHNDYITVLVQTGIVGFVLYMGIQLLMLQRIIGMRGREKFAFAAMFLAVVAISIGVNAYVTRTALGQLYFFVMSYLEIAERRKQRV